MPLICGTVMEKKRRMVPAPSISAASCSSIGTVCRPARSMTIIQGNDCQVFATITAIMAVVGFASHACGESMRPTVSRAALSTP